MGVEFRLSADAIGHVESMCGVFEVGTDATVSPSVDGELRTF